jgi:hypothetical protein
MMRDTNTIRSHRTALPTRGDLRRASRGLEPVAVFSLISKVVKTRVRMPHQQAR